MKITSASWQLFWKVNRHLGSHYEGWVAILAVIMKVKSPSWQSLWKSSHHLGSRHSEGEVAISGVHTTTPRSCHHKQPNRKWTGEHPPETIDWSTAGYREEKQRRFHLMNNETLIMLIVNGHDNENSKNITSKYDETLCYGFHLIADRLWRLNSTDWSRI